MVAEQPSAPAKRRRWPLVAVALAALLTADLARPPRRQLSARALLVSIDVYQATLSKALSYSSVRCRFTPSCSRYGEAVIAEHGALKGSALAAWRVLRCGPWTPAGTVEEPPRRHPEAAEETAP